VSGIYWLVLLLVVSVTGIYGRYWYRRPSGMPEMLTASYSYQTLQRMNAEARRKGEDLENCDIHLDSVIVPYMKARKLAWRQRNDVIDYMKKMDWIYEFKEQGTTYYSISRVGKQELETADGLRGAIREAAQLLHDEGISTEQAKAAAAAVIATALRVDARSAPAESREPAEESASEIEEAVRADNPDKIDRTITRVKDVLQIATYALPFARDILRTLGWF
jgi:hypothetical protein